MVKALFLTPVREDKKAEFENILDATFKDKKDVKASDFEDVEVVFGNPPKEFLNGPSLRWVQLDSAGANTYKNLPERILLTNCSGAYGTAISEHMLACTLAVMKNLYRYYDLQKEQCWENLGSVPTLHNMHVLVIGMGDIGSAYARIMHSLGAHVSGVRRNVHERPSYVEKLYTMDNFDEGLKEADVIALSLPETKETIGLFNKERIRLCKKGAVILNVGRGSAIVEEDLIQAMKESHFSAVCLDVTKEEPLPLESPLWNTDRVYITPHIAGRFNAEVTYDKVLDIFLTNLKHYLNGEPLEHTVNRTLGY